MDITVSIMETTELRYFLAVAEVESVNQAARKISLSPGSLSKAIAKLETELQVKLFNRVGRRIEITKEGRILQKRATEIISLEQSARIELSGDAQEINVVLSGEELLLANHGSKLADTIIQKFPLARVSLSTSSNSESLMKINQGESHLALMTEKPPNEILFKKLDRVKFYTVVGKKHPLYKWVRKKKHISIDELLMHSFVLPQDKMLGSTKPNQSVDGWRDDEFPRKISYRVSSLKILESLVLSGTAVAYLPDYYIKNLDVGIIDVSGCPYTCEQTVYLICRNLKEHGWLNQIW